MEVFLAAAASFFFALGTVLQQKGAVSEPGGSPSGAAKLLLRLARRPVWLGGIFADGLGFVCQAVALAVGRLVVVQPILATSVVFALPLGAKITNQRISRRDVFAAVAVTAGLAVFLVIGNPEGGRDNAPFGEWLIAIAPIAVLAGILVGLGWRSSPGVKAALFGTAAGLFFGLSAALTKATVDRLIDDGITGVLFDWHLYMLLLVGYAGMTLSEISLQTGVLAPAIATFSILDAVTSVVLGITLLREDLRHDFVGIFLILVSLGIMFAGLVVLAGSQGARDGPETSAAGS
jgi:drug/metabolite transporter (DMT)-like permease